jgi:hypothetical protein
MDVKSKRTGEYYQFEGILNVSGISTREVEQ